MVKLFSAHLREGLFHSSDKFSWLCKSVMEHDSLNRSIISSRYWFPWITFLRGEVFCLSYIYCCDLCMVFVRIMWISITVMTGCAHTARGRTWSHIYIYMCSFCLTLAEQTAVLSLDSTKKRDTGERDVCSLKWMCIITVMCTIIHERQVRNKKDLIFRGVL